jgi:hypothetical protein
MFRRLVTSSSSSSQDSMDGTESSSSSSSSSSTISGRTGRHKGSIDNLSAWVVARVAAVQHTPEAAAAAAAAAAAGKRVSSSGLRVLLQRYFRPEDISRDLAYRRVAGDTFSQLSSILVLVRCAAVRGFCKPQ